MNRHTMHQVAVSAQAGEGPTIRLLCVTQVRSNPRSVLNNTRRLIRVRP